MKDQLVIRSITKNTEDYIREYLKGKHRRNNLVKWVGGIAEVVYFWLVPMEHTSRVHQLCQSPLGGRCLRL